MEQLVPHCDVNVEPTPTPGLLIESRMSARQEHLKVVSQPSSSSLVLVVVINDGTRLKPQIIEFAFSHTCEVLPGTGKMPRPPCHLSLV